MTHIIELLEHKFTCFIGFILLERMNFPKEKFSVRSKWFIDVDLAGISDALPYFKSVAKRNETDE